MRVLFRSVIAATLAVASVTAPPLVRAAAAECTLGANSREPCKTPWLDEGAKLSALEGAPRRAPSETEAAAGSDAVRPEAKPADHRVRSIVAVGLLYAGFMTWAHYAWYADKIDHGFEVADDGYFGKNTYAGGADKLGHAWANLAWGRGSAHLLRSQGWGETSSAVLGGAMAWTLFLFVEYKDGYAYRFSPGDMVFNTAGATLGALQEIFPRLDALVDYRVAYAPSDEYLGLWRGEYYGTHKGNSLNIAEDYSGQTYFLALHLGALPKVKDVPAPLGTALSYLDVGVAFESRKYKPDAPPEAVPTQEVFIGVTLDLQKLSDRALAKHRIPRKIAHGILEVMSPPYTILPTVSSKRSSTGPLPEQ